MHRQPAAASRILPDPGNALFATSRKTRRGHGRNLLSLSVLDSEDRRPLLRNRPPPRRRHRRSEFPRVDRPVL